MADERKDIACMEALGELRSFIAKELPGGGWLPGSSTMAAKLGVSELTYAKAVKRLIEESEVRSYPKKGYYVPLKLFKRFKAGFVVDGGKDSPFLHGPSTFGRLVSLLFDAACGVQIIQAKRSADIVRKARLHGVSILVWLKPGAKDLLAMKALLGEGLPLLAVELMHPYSAADADYGDVPSISCDHSALGRARAGFFLAKGFKRVAYVGKHWFARHSSLESELKGAGVDFSERDCCPDDPLAVREKLPALIASRRPQGLFSEGTEELIHAVCETLASLPEETRPKLVVNGACGREALLLAKRRFPGVKLSGVGVWRGNNVPELAAKAILESARSGLPPVSARATESYEVLPAEVFLAGEGAR